MLSKKVVDYLNSRNDKEWLKLYELICDKYHKEWKQFKLEECSTFSLRDICAEVGYHWMQDNRKDNAILALDTAILHAK